MKKHLRREYQLLFAVASALMVSGAAWTEGPGANVPNADTTGFAILNNATNVTHWGLGAGAAFEQSPYKGYGTHITPIPFFFFDGKWIHAIGTTIDLKVGKWDGLEFTLRGNCAIADGYKGSDAPILNGMQTRRAAFWLGPAFKWDTRYGDLSGDYLTGGNKGQKAGIEFGKTLDYGRFSIEPHAGVNWLSGTYVDYYYGVRTSEARAGRPAYTGTSTYKESAGAKFDYRLQVRQLLHFAEVSESQNFEFGEVDKVDVVEDVVDYLARKADKKQVKLHVDAPVIPATMRADRSALFILLKNIVENAINATPTHGSVIVSVDEKTICIQDEGPGVNPEHLPFLFERFWRAPDAQHDGAGLGLSICKEIALAHNWKLSVRTLTSGTRFIVSF